MADPSPLVTPYLCKCPHCNAKLKHNGTCVGRTVKCPGCEKPLRIPEIAKQDTGEVQPVVELAKPETEATGKSQKAMLAIEELEGHLKIAVPWFRLSFGRVGMTTVAILGCLLFGATAANSIGLLTSEERQEEVRSVGGFLFSSAAVLSCMYVMAAYWSNRTMLDVTNDVVSVYTKPFPLPWVRTAHTLAIADVSQLFVQEIQNRHWETPLPSSYEVRALLECGERITLLDISKVTGSFDIAEVTGRSSDARNWASTVEERIEAFLGIEHVRVDEEIIVRTYESPTGGCAGGGGGGEGV
jgi:hypothetical protein